MNEGLDQVEHLFLAFADKTRLQLLYLLRDGEVSVNALSEALDTSQPKVSRHLAYLRTMNMVTTRREGKSIFYKLNVPSNPFGASIVDETIDWLDSFSGFPRDESHAKRGRNTVIQPPVDRPFLTYDESHESELAADHAPEYDEVEMEVYLL